MFYGYDFVQRCKILFYVLPFLELENAFIALFFSILFLYYQPNNPEEMLVDDVEVSSIIRVSGYFSFY